MVGWLALLAFESSDYGSSEHTGSILWKLWALVLGRPDSATFDEVHHLIRKTGHFTGYAILSWLIFHALRVAWRNRQQVIARGREYFWQLRWALGGIAGTMIAGSLDEFHQAFNPARTGRWQDVVLDTSGAVVLQTVLFLVLNTRKLNRAAEQAEA